jgi:hypothetical protein
MPNENDLHRRNAWQTNVEASLTYAERLWDQIPKSLSIHCKAVSDLAVAARFILLDELSSLKGNDREHDEHVKMLLEVACARLGYRLLPGGFPVQHYQVEVTRKKLSTFIVVVSCPSHITPEDYLALLYAPKGDYRSCRVISKLTASEAERIVQEGLALKSEKKKQSVVQVGVAEFMNATTEELEVIEIAEESGILEVFTNIIQRYRKMLNQPLPHSMSTFFLSFLRSLAHLELSPESRGALANEFGGTIDVYQANGIAMVLSGGEIRWFCFASELKNHHKKQGSATLKLNGKTMVKGTRTNDSILRTRLGYVPASAHIFLQALLHYGPGNPRREVQPVSIQPNKK